MAYATKEKKEEYRRAWRLANLERERAKERERARRYPERTKLAARRQALSEYGLTLEQYDQLFRKQEGLCALCRQLESRIMRGKLVALAVDHDHITGKVRGLLCTKCNVGIGMFINDSKLLWRAIEYLGGVGKEFAQ